MDTQSNQEKKLDISVDVFLHPLRYITYWSASNCVCSSFIPDDMNRSR